MGINGLLKGLRSVTETEVHVKEYRGQTVVVDISSWLYKGACSCSFEIGMGYSSEKYVDYVMRRVQMLKHHGVRPFMVFDGKALPLKAEEQATRRQGRQGHLETGRRIMKESKDPNLTEQERMVSALWWISLRAAPFLILACAVEAGARSSELPESHSRHAGHG